ncbi:hypothetical protein HGB07_03615 [Candidatus Roizmanbacteria bacterium]|nr:hypothetical protein [Candidatus Roizmanbacteria bacterium]
MVSFSENVNTPPPRRRVDAIPRLLRYLSPKKPGTPTSEAKSDGHFKDSKQVETLLLDVYSGKLGLFEEEDWLNRIDNNTSSIICNSDLLSNILINSLSTHDPDGCIRLSMALSNIAEICRLERPAIETTEFSKFDAKMLAAASIITAVGASRSNELHISTNQPPQLIVLRNIDAVTKMLQTYPDLFGNDTEDLYNKTVNYLSRQGNPTAFFMSDFAPLPIPDNFDIYQNQNPLTKRLRFVRAKATLHQLSPYEYRVEHEKKSYGNILRKVEDWVSNFSNLKTGAAHYEKLGELWSDICPEYLKTLQSENNPDIQIYLGYALANIVANRLIKDINQQTSAREGKTTAHTAYNSHVVHERSSNENDIVPSHHDISLAKEATYLREMIKASEGTIPPMTFEDIETKFVGISTESKNDSLNSYVVEKTSSTIADQCKNLIVEIAYSYQKEPNETLRKEYIDMMRATYSMLHNFFIIRNYPENIIPAMYSHLSRNTQEIINLATAR